MFFGLKQSTLNNIRFYNRIKLEADAISTENLAIPWNLLFWVSTFSRRFGGETYSSVETPLVFPDTELKYMSIDKVKIYSLMCVLCYHRETPPKYRISHYFSSFTPLFILKWMLLWINSFFYYIFLYSFYVLLFSISDNSRGRKNFKQN